MGCFMEMSMENNKIFSTLADEKNNKIFPMIIFFHDIIHDSMKYLMTNSIKNP